MGVRAEHSGDSRFGIWSWLQQKGSLRLDEPSYKILSEGAIRRRYKARIIYEKVKKTQGWLRERMPE